MFYMPYASGGLSGLTQTTIFDVLELQDFTRTFITWTFITWTFLVVSGLSVWRHRPAMNGLDSVRSSLATQPRPPSESRPAGGSCEPDLPKISSWGDPFVLSCLLSCFWWPSIFAGWNFGLHLFCGTGLPLASTWWVRSRFWSHCPLSTYLLPELFWEHW